MLLFLQFFEYIVEMFGQCGTFAWFFYLYSSIETKHFIFRNWIHLFATIITRACFKTHLQIFIFVTSRLPIMVKFSLTLKIFTLFVLFFIFCFGVWSWSVKGLFNVVQLLLFTYIYILSSMLYWFCFYFWTRIWRHSKDLIHRWMEA